MFSSTGYNTAIIDKCHVGSKIPKTNHSSWKRISEGYHKDILNNPEHDWTKFFVGRPQDIGFNSSLSTLAVIQSPPFAFFRDGVLEAPKSDTKHWERGPCQMLHGISKITIEDEGNINWDSTGVTCW